MTHRPLHKPARTGRTFRRAPWVLPGILLLATGIGPAAYAFWQTESSNYAATAADSIPAGGKPAVTTNGAGLSVNWTAATTASGRPVSGYTVTRYAVATGGTAIPATGACAGTVTALTCTEQGVPGGLWYYTVTPAIALWTGAESPRSDGIYNDTTAPVATASLTQAPNTAGWNNTSPVTVTINAQDDPAGSGVASITYTLDTAAPVTISAATASFPVSGDGTHTVSYSALDNAGNTTPVQTRIIRIDTAAPAVPVLSVPEHINVANAAAVLISGTAEPGATISLTVRDAGSAHTATAVTTASGTGAWSLSPNLTSLTDGTVTYSAAATDAAGNTGAAGTLTGTKDTGAPAVPALSVPGYVNTANVASVPVTGTAEPGSTLTLTVTDAGAAHTVTGVTTTSGTGTWSVTGLNLASLNQGTVSYSAVASDAAGNTGAPASAINLKDTLAPAAPGLTVPPYVNASTASIQVTGTAEPGALITFTVTDAGSSHSIPRTAAASSSGAWNVTGLNLGSFNDGVLSYTATATDAAGNIGTAATATGKKDVIAPSVSGITLANGTGSPKSTASTADRGDTLTLQYSEAMDPARFCPLWNGTAPLSGTVTLSDGGTGGSNDTLSVSATGCTTLALGTLALGANYIGTTPAVFGANGAASTLTWDPATNTLILKLGTLANNSGTPLTQVNSGNPAYTPAANLSDLAGNPLATSTTTSATKTGF
ncbi:beta strand repeat-containing protein [Arthrobacter humicola]